MSLRPRAPRPVASAAVVAGVLLGLTTGCRGAEAATQAELCAALTQVEATVVDLAQDPPDHSPAELAVRLADDVELARETAARQSEPTLTSLVRPALRASDRAYAALRSGGDAGAALGTAAEQARAALDAAGCATAYANGPSTQ